MTKEQIKIEINKCERQINKCNSKLKDLDKKAKELDKAYEKIKNKYNEFGQKNSSKIGKIAKILIDGQAVPMSKGIYNSMKSTYLGKDFQRAEQGFIQAMEKIKVKRNDVYDEIDENKYCVKKFNERLIYLKHQLAAEIAKEGVQS